MKNNRSLLLATLLIGGAWVGETRAHATLETTEAPSGAFYKVTVKIPHGCKGSPTTAVRVTIPPGLVAVKPMPKPGWTLATIKGTYAQAVLGYNGKTVAEGVVEIVWSGGLLSDEHYDEFVFQTLVSESLRPGERVPVEIVQTCVSGEVAWRETADRGRPDHKLVHPAPILTIVAPRATSSRRSHSE